MWNDEKTEYGPPLRHGDASAGQTDKGRPKYYDILDAVNHLVDARMCVQGLCEQIVGVAVKKGIPEDAKKSEKKPSLLDVLDKTPGIISKEVDMINGAVNEIRALIL